MNPDPLTCVNCRRELAPAALFCPACGTPRVREGATDDLIGKVLGERFLVQERLGQGKSGTIYRAEHVTLRRKVAIKVLHDGLSRDDLAIERFRREATSVAEIDNEHIVEIHDFGRTPDGRLYLAMELLEGETLDAALARDGKMPIDRVADVVMQVGEALVEAHSVGFVHRDLRPRNLYLAARRGKANFVKLLDFGLSKLVESGGAAASTSLGMTFGDPRYMSPEQAKGDAIDRRADIYSLGCIAYEMLTGEPPFVGGKVFDVLTRHVNEKPQPVRSKRPDVPAWLDAAIMRSLAKSPDDRFVTAQKMVEAMRVGLATGAIPAEEAVPVAVPAGDSSSSTSDSRRGPTGTPAVGVPVVPPPVASAAAPASAAAAAPQNLRATVTGIPPAPGGVEPSASERVSMSITAQSPAVAADPDDADDDDNDDDEDPADSVPTQVVPRGKRRTGPAADGPTEGTVRPSDSMNLSGAWFAAGDGESLGDSQVRSLEKARRNIDPGDSLLDDGAPDSGPPTKKIFIIAGVATVVLVVAVMVIGSGGKSNKTKDDGKSAAGLVTDGGSGSASALAGSDSAITPPVVDDAGATVTPPVADASVATSSGSGSASGSGKASGGGGGGGGSAKASGTGTGSSGRTIDDPFPTGGSGGGSGGGGGAADDDAKKMAEFYAKAGEAALRGGDPSGAAGNFQKALASNPNNVDAILGMGEVAMQQGLYTDAIRQLKRAAKLAPRSARVHVLLGESHLNSGNASLAEQSFKKALQLDPDNVRARNGYNEAAGRLPPPTDDL
ncbi:MAG TPA: protein kinase [Kofleriaceae bacterium]|nr:protein kinase [Kofleriaceae bacterium]